MLCAASGVLRCFGAEGGKLALGLWGLLGVLEMEWKGARPYMRGQLCPIRDDGCSLEGLHMCGAVQGRRIDTTEAVEEGRPGACFDGSACTKDARQGLDSHILPCTIQCFFDPPMSPVISEGYNGPAFAFLSLSLSARTYPQTLPPSPTLSLAPARPLRTFRPGKHYSLTHTDSPPVPPRTNVPPENPPSPTRKSGTSSCDSTRPKRVKRRAKRGRWTSWVP